MMGDEFVESLAVEVSVVAIELLYMQCRPILVYFVIDGLRLAAIAHISSPCLLD